MKAKGAQLAVVPLLLLQAEVPTKAAPPKLQAQIVAAAAAGRRCERAAPPFKPSPVLPALPIQAAATARLESGVSPLPWLEPSMQPPPAQAAVQAAVTAPSAVVKIGEEPGPPWKAPPPGQPVFLSSDSARPGS